MKNFHQFFKTLHHARAGAADQVIIEVKHVLVLDRLDRVPTWASGDLFGGDTAVQRVAQQDNFRVLARSVLPG